MQPDPAKPAPSLRRAFAFSLAQKYLAFVVQLATTIILARLLSPHETGVFSLAAAAVGIGHLLRDFGMADYVIAQKDVTDEKLRSAFTLTVLLAWAIALVLLLLAHPLASLYKEPSVASVLQLLCVSFVLLPFGTVAFAMLSKQLQFGRIFAAQTGAVLLGAAVTLGAAWQGQGALSMALGSVVSNLWTIGYLLVFQPGLVFLRPRFAGLGGVLRFGGALTGARLIEQAANRSSDFIVAGTLGFHAGGLLSKASSLIGSFHEFFNAAVVRVATPAFAQTTAGSDTERERYIQATVLVATALWLFFPFLGVFAHEIVLLLFGPNWLECVPVVQISAVGAMCWAPFMLSSSLLTARGAVGEQMRIQLVAAPLTVGALLVGAQFSLVVLALTTNAVMLVRFLMIDAAMRRRCNLGAALILRALWPSAVVATAACAAGLAFKWGIAGLGLGLPLLVLLPVAGALVGLAALGAARALGHPAYAEVMRLLQGRFGTWRSSRPS